MTQQRFDEIRDKDHLLIQQVESGNDYVQKITSATILENHHVTYVFEKLEVLDLLQVPKPDGTVERVIDGKKRIFDAPKVARLTQKAAAYFEWTNREDPIDQYRNLSHDELAERIYELEQQVDELQQGLKTFRRQVKDHL